MHSGADRIKRHAQCNTTANCHTCRHEPVPHDRPEVVIHLFLEVVVNSRHHCAERPNAQAVCDSASHKCAFMGNPLKRLYEIAVVPAGFLRVDLICLHACVNHLERVSEHPCYESSQHMSVYVEVRAAIATRVIHQSVVEIQEAGCAGCSVRECPEQEGVDVTVELAEASSRTVDFLEDAEGRVATVEADAVVGLALLEDH